MDEMHEIQEIFQDNNRVFIYGTGSRARSLYQYIEKSIPKGHTVTHALTGGSAAEAAEQGIQRCSVSGFITASIEESMDAIFRQHVYVGNEAEKLDKTIPILIAARQENHYEIEVWLQSKGFARMIPITPQIENWFRLSYVRTYYEEQGLDFVQLKDAVYDSLTKQLYIEEETEQVSLYMVRSVWDSGQECTAYPQHIVPIQAGAALTDKRICEYADDNGENISRKNKQYSELTAIYWLWKHVQADYIGICHYRRHFIVTREMLKRLELAGVDVVLPIPAVVFPDVETDYKLRHGSGKWNIMLQVLRDEYPQYYNAAEKEFAQECYYGCNMWIMRHDIMDRFLTWLFSILEKIERLAGMESADAYQNRYIGFLSERLTGVFFRHHRDEWNIVHAEKLFMA